MKQIVFILIGAMLMCSAKVHAQQDAQFSQYMFNGLYINPAYAGYKEQWNINTFYRNQWTGFPGAPKTLSLAVDGSSDDNRVGMGLQIMNDQLGAQNNTAIYGNYAYRIPLDEYEDKKLALGIGAGFIQQRINLTALEPIDHNDPTILNAQKTALLPDARTGIFYNSQAFYTGLSADNLISYLFQKKPGIKDLSAT